VAQVEAQQPLRMGEDGTELEEIGFVFDFKYLGHWFQSDGDGMRNIEIRMAQAGSAFGRLNHIWRDKRLSKRVKLNCSRSTRPSSSRSSSGASAPGS
jgi:hypothetical protein